MRARLSAAIARREDRRLSRAAGDAITYTPSSAWVNSNNPPLVQAVSSKTTNDGRGNAWTSAYHYAGGLYDFLNRRFLGFHYAKAIMPCIASDGATCTTPGQALM